MIEGSTKSTPVLTLLNFVRLMKGLQHGEFTGIGPEKLNLALGKLELSLKRSFDGLDPETELQSYISTLFGYAKQNNNKCANASTADAEYILGFLLHHDIHVEMLDASGKRCIESIRTLMLSEAPSYEVEYFEKGHAHYEKHQKMMPENGFHFMDLAWRKRQNYPTLEKVAACYQAQQQSYAQFLQRLKVVEAQWAEQRMQVFSEKYASLAMSPISNGFQNAPLTPLKHVADNRAINLETLSWVIEIFFRKGIVHLPGQKSFGSFNPTLSTGVALAIEHFVVSARKNSNGFLQNETSVAFENMLRTTMTAAVTDTNMETRNAAQLVIGFLIYQNFLITHQGKTLSIRQAVDTILTENDKAMLKSQHAVFPFLFDTSWLESRGFPTRENLEVFYRQQAQLSMIASPQAFGLHSNFTATLYARSTPAINKTI
jgi:hypothetical protein